MFPECVRVGKKTEDQVLLWKSRNEESGTLPAGRDVSREIG
jgi:hypothetical protein